MEIIQREPIFSKPGKADRHAHSNVFSLPRRRPKPKSVEPVPITNIKGLLEELEQEYEAELEAKKAKMKPSPSFSSVSRDEYEFAFRSKTGSPKVGNYSPKDEVTSPRKTVGPKLVPHTSISKEKKVFLGKCIDKELNCSYPRKIPIKDLNFNERLSRSLHNESEYEEILRQKKIKWSPIPEKIISRTISPIKFEQQKSRTPFINGNGPPNDKRFDFLFPNSLHLSKNERASSIDIEKASWRGGLFPLGMALGAYDRNEEATLPKLSRLVPNFEKLSGRKPLCLDHIVKNPISPDLNRLDQAMKLQSEFRGHVKIPLMDEESSRDDIMYRNIEMYKLNVPNKQDCMSVPKFMGDSTSDLVSRSRLTATVLSFANSSKLTF